jgi:hypothetical protein
MCGVRTSPLYATNQQCSVHIQAAETVSKGDRSGCRENEGFQDIAAKPGSDPFALPKSVSQLVPESMFDIPALLV